jgi:hypothetical protein
MPRVSEAEKAERLRARLLFRQVDQFSDARIVKEFDLYEI